MGKSVAAVFTRTGTRVMRVLVIAHGHPALQKGGGEVAAYSVFQMLKSNGHASVFLGWSGKEVASGGAESDLSRLAQDDYLINGRVDYFDFSSRTMSLRSSLETLFREHEFDVVHMHHYVHIGIEIAAIAKAIKPTVRTVLTLHEYLAICNNHGQLFTTNGMVCSGYRPERCVKCFPSRSQEEFFMRELTIKAAFSFVDVFISPSKFLKERYCEWGLKKDRVFVIENPLPIRPDVQMQTSEPIEEPSEWRLGFFGQINFYKGVDILLEGIKLANRVGHRFTIGIHGKMAPIGAMPDYLGELQALLQSLEGTAVVHGAYNQEDVIRLMQEYHFVAMGSRWYENSPVVIQEAIAAGRPLIVPGHGGMMEKVQGIGITYDPNSSLSLCDRLLSLNYAKYRELSREVDIMQTNCTERASNDFKMVLDLYSSELRLNVTSGRG
jgi:glycosyltransferase involved in cell wall biosynthesis